MANLLRATDIETTGGTVVAVKLDVRSMFKAAAALNRLTAVRAA